MTDEHTILVKGAIGAAASTASVAVSFWSDVEILLRIGSLVIGCAVGVVTLISLYRKIPPKK